MSYILDALKKADSERERGAIPGIHAQQVPYMAVTAKPAGNLKLVLWLIVGLLTVILGALAWRMTSTGDALPVQVAAAPPSLPPPAPAADSGKPAVVASSVPQTPPPTTEAAPAKPEPANASSAAVKTAAKDKAAMSKPTTVRTETRPVAKAAAPKAGVTAASAETRVYALAELPDDVQRDLPKLTISGGTYSSNPAQRLLIVNNQVFLEGGQPAPGVTVEQIRQNAAVLSFKGYRYRVAY
ncbi:MAG: general secretion pathway protein GspB [Rhodoferax sp.]|nr:general secretion pathway protein GspB [Rhodoferax sp.]